LGTALPGTHGDTAGEAAICSQLKPIPRSPTEERAGDTSAATGEPTSPALSMIFSSAARKFRLRLE